MGREMMGGGGRLWEMHSLPFPLSQPLRLSLSLWHDDIYYDIYYDIYLER